MKKRILIIDDEVLLLNILLKALTKKGYETIIETNAKKVLKNLDDIKPDLIITDIVMPDMDGIDFIFEISKIKKEIPLIVMSGNYIGKDFLETAVDFGAIDKIKKPFDLEEIYEKIEKIFDK